MSHNVVFYIFLSLFNCVGTIALMRLFYCSYHPRYRPTHDQNNKANRKMLVLFVCLMHQIFSLAFYKKIEDSFLTEWTLKLLGTFLLFDYWKYIQSVIKSRRFYP